MHRGSVRVVLVVALMCVAVGVGCARSREYVSLSYQPTLEEGEVAERGPTLLLIPSFRDAREGMAPNIVGYVDRYPEADTPTLALRGDASLAEEMTEEVARLYRLYGFEVFTDPARAEGRIDAELRGDIVTFIVRTPSPGWLGKATGEGAVNLRLWHPKEDKPLWMATLKASTARSYQWSLTKGRAAAADDIYSQLLRGVERSIPSVEERIKKYYRTGK